MKFQHIIFALDRIIQVLISLEYFLFNAIPESLVTLQFLKSLIVQIKAYIHDFQMRYQSFLVHWYPNSYSCFSDSIDIPFVLISTVYLKGGHYYKIDLYFAFVVVIKRGRLIEKVRLIMAYLRYMAIERSRHPANDFMRVGLT